MKNYRSLSRIVSMLLICGLTATLNANDNPPHPTLTLSVKLNGKRILGSQEMAVKFSPDGQLTKDKSQLKAAFDSNIVTVKPGSRSALTVFLVEPTGEMKDVTTDPGLYVEATLGQVQFSKGILVAEPEESFGKVNLSAPVVLSVYYFKDANKQVFGFDQFYLRVQD